MRREPAGCESLHVAAIALGSNLGSRSRALESARAAIIVRIGPIRRCSAIYETSPVGPPGQREYLNQIVLVETPMSPEALLDATQDIERDLGRERAERWGPRVIDLDLLLCGDRVCCEETLTIPHPRMHERGFVLIPLAEVLPGWVHPKLGQSVEQMCRDVDASGITHYADGSATQPKGQGSQGG